MIKLIHEDGIEAFLENFSKFMTSDLDNLRLSVANISNIILIEQVAYYYWLSNTSLNTLAEHFFHSQKCSDTATDNAFPPRPQSSQMQMQMQMQNPMQTQARRYMDGESTTSEEAMFQ
jgi:hypothetical protein